MCGISGIILNTPGSVDLARAIQAMNGAIAHRGPDGEGFMLAGQNFERPASRHVTAPSAKPLPYLPQQDVEQAAEGAYLALGHRRLSIIDLSEAGHQPMCNAAREAWITFNGEIYNYIELRQELSGLGHRFISGTDTEVILHAYSEWGFNCVEKFNGMWAFCIYDVKKQICFASRDRLGVKPFYYSHNKSFFAFASEQKAFSAAGLVPAKAEPGAVGDYLFNARLETGSANFFSNISELWPGTNLIYSLASAGIRLSSYFNMESLVSSHNDSLPDESLIEKIRETFNRAIALRLRSDVEVGTCLSGGIDSSAIAVTIAAISGKPLSCFTAVFPGHAVNEEQYADLVVKRIGGLHFKTAPDPDGFISHLDELLYAQDVPVWDSSTFAQHQVMGLAARQGIKVVLDGQGADELFAGYHHHFTARWNELAGAGLFMELAKDLTRKNGSIASPLLFYMKELVKQKINFNTKHYPLFFTKEMIRATEIINPFKPAPDVNTQLIRDISETRLKSFLKCEDRCGMWHSVESRTPFSDDINLMSLMFSFKGRRKIKNGVSKYLLREALRSKLPEQIYSRMDKKGFDTPMQDWMKQLRPVMLANIREARFPFVNYAGIERSEPGNVFHNKILFRLFILSRWQKVFKTA